MIFKVFLYIRKCKTKQMEDYKITAHERSLYQKQHDKAKFNTAEEEYRYASVTHKVCTKCDVSKTLNEYGGNTSGCDAFDRDGYRLRRPECRICNKQIARGKNDAMKVAKLTGIAYKAPEGTVCVLCCKPAKRGDSLVFDHDHETNTFRGYLHNSCNRSLGVLGDDVESLLRAVNYLNKTANLNIVRDKDSGELRIGD